MNIKLLTKINVINLIVLKNKFDEFAMFYSEIKQGLENYLSNDKAKLLQYMTQFVITYKNKNTSLPTSKHIADFISKTNLYIAWLSYIYQSNQNNKIYSIKMPCEVPM